MSDSEAKFMPWDDAQAQITDFGFSSAQVELKDLQIHASREKGLTEFHIGLPGESSCTPATPKCIRDLGKIFDVDLKRFYEFNDDPDLSARVLDFYKSRASVEGVVLSRDREGFRSAVDDPEKYVAPDTVFSLARETLGDQELGIASVSYSRSHANLEFLALTNHTATPPRKVGEVSHAGVNFNVNGGVKIEPSVFTLICTNGMIGESAINCESGVHERDIREAVQRAQTLVSRFVALDEVPIENIAATTSRIAGELNLSDRAARNIEDAVSRQLTDIDHQPTAYELVNVVTALSHSAGSARFSRIGGQMLGVVEVDRCDHCGAAIAD